MNKLIPVFLLPLLLAGAPSRAMDFEVQNLGGRNFIDGTGEIRSGDQKRFADIIRTASSSGGFAAFSFDTPGGSVTAAIDMAQIIRKSGIPVYVFSRKECASACILLLAAGMERHVGIHAAIGVHRGAIGGREDPNVQFATARMAQLLESYGLPEGAVVKLLETPPGGITWLHASDLESMHIRLMP